MFLALISYHIYHPGRALVGPDSEYPKLSKEEKDSGKEEKAAKKEEKRRAKGEKRSEISESELMDRDVEA
jgi:hypothetical protein